MNLEIEKTLREAESKGALIRAIKEMREASSAMMDECGCEYCERMVKETDRREQEAQHLIREGPVGPLPFGDLQKSMWTWDVCKRAYPHDIEAACNLYRSVHGQEPPHLKGE